MPAATLNQFRCELRPQSCDCGQKVLLDWVSSLCFGFLEASSAVQSFGSDNVCCPKRELVVMVLGLSFYPLEQAPNRVIYAMSKRGTATSGLIYFSGLGPSLGTNARRCCQNIPLQTRA